MVYGQSVSLLTNDKLIYILTYDTSPLINSPGLWYREDPEFSHTRRLSSPPWFFWGDVPIDTFFYWSLKRSGYRSPGIQSSHTLCCFGPFIINLTCGLCLYFLIYKRSYSFVDVLKNKRRTYHRRISSW